jgi:hypothetical protein
MNKFVIYFLLPFAFGLKDFVAVDHYYIRAVERQMAPGL